MLHELLRRSDKLVDWQFLGMTDRDQALGSASSESVKDHALVL